MKQSKQNWLIEKIPTEWKDKDFLMELIIFECIKHYVEKEKCLKVLATKPNPKRPDVVDCSFQYKFLAEVKENYRIITKEIPKLEKKLEKEWDKVPHIDIENLGKEINKGDYDKKYGKLDELDKKINDLKTEIMIWAVKNRAQMWT